MRNLLPPLLCLLLVSAAQAQYWQWSEPAEHHKAAVVVRSPESGGSMAVTSGTYISFGQGTGVLTCAHGIKSREVDVTFSDGRVERGLATCDKDGHDIAFVYVTHPTIQPVPFSQSPPQVGERVEFVTYGGPDTSIRYFWAQVTSTTSQSTETTGKVTYGDSGGGILNERGELVAVQSVGTGGKLTTANVGGASFDVFQGSGSASFPAIQAFLNRVHTQCYGGQCFPPASQPRMRAGAGVGIEFYPPKRQQPQQQQPAPAPQPQQPLVSVDEVKRLQNQLKALEAAKCECDQSGQDDRLAKIEAAIIELHVQIQGLHLGKPQPKPEQPKSQKPAPCDSVKCEELERRIAALEASVHPDAVAESVIQRLPPSRVDFLDGKGKAAYSQTVPVGGTIKIPPVHIQNYDRNAKLIDEEKYPLPSPVRLRHGVYFEGR